MLSKFLTIMSLIGFTAVSYAVENDAFTNKDIFSLNEIKRLNNEINSLNQLRAETLLELDSMEEELSLLRERKMYAEQFFAGNLSLEFKAKELVLSRIKDLKAKLTNIKGNLSAEKQFIHRLTSDILLIEKDIAEIRNELLNITSDLEWARERVRALEH
jgi:septation ring formation regulator EzrA